MSASQLRVLVIEDSEDDALLLVRELRRGGYHPDYERVDTPEAMREATSDPDDASLVMAIITLSHNLRLKVVAEGVETDDQWKFLRLLRCDEAQGYLFSRPLPAEGFREHYLSTQAAEMHEPVAV